MNAEQLRDDPRYAPLQHGEFVRVYRNLTRGCLSVMRRGLVVAHVESIALHRARFVVHEAGRQRVLRERRKNVHAFVEGIWTERADRGLDCCYGGMQLPVVEVTYNPHKYATFVRRDTEEPVRAAHSVVVDAKGVRVRWKS